MKTLVNTADLSHQQWLEWRQKGIGGSDAGAICGLNKYRSPIAVYLDKTAETVVEKPINEAMRLGHDFEAYVAMRWCEHMDEQKAEELGIKPDKLPKSQKTKVQRDNRMLQHDKYPWMLADIDRRVVGENAGLECKTCSPYAAGKWEDDGIPPEYLIQCLHYMAVTGADRWYLACLIYQQGMQYRVIDRKEDWVKEGIRNLIQIEQDFWENNVLKHQMPAPDGSEAADKALTMLYPESDPEKQVVEIEDLSLDRYDEISMLIDDLTAEKKQIEQSIKTKMKNAERANLDGRAISWKSYSGREDIDKKRFRKDHPDLFEEYKKVGKPYRRFTISKAPKEEA